MKELNVEEIRKIQLQILKNVSEYSDKNNIRYSLAYGTLIGSIRHKGYIPWDDDIDIAMPRPDYDKFIRNFNGCIKGYSVHAAEIDSDFVYTFAKVSYDKSILIEETNIKYDIGINIDIFPIDGLPIDDNKEVMKKQNFYRNLANFKIVKLSSSRSVVKNIFLLLGKILLFWLPLKTINTKMINNSRTYSFDSEDYCCNISTGLMANKPIPRRYLEEYIECNFENQIFNASKSYDKWLLSIYGDYKQMPPKEKQVTHHKYKAYKK